jgi:hypothetical protein
VEHVAYIGAIRNVGLHKLEGNRPVKLYKCKLEDNIKTDLRICSLLRYRIRKPTARIKTDQIASVRKPFLLLYREKNMYGMNLGIEDKYKMEEIYLLEYSAMQSVESQPTFRRKISPPSSGPKNNTGK